MKTKQPTLKITYFDDFIKKISLLLTFFFLTLSSAFAQSVEGNGNTLLIFQIGASQAGSNSANVSHSFVELYNAGDEAVDLSSFSLQFAAGTRHVHDNPDADGAWQKIDLSGIIQPGHSFLILVDRLSTMPNPALNIADNSGDMNVSGFVLSNRSVKLVLLNNQNLLSNDIQNPFDPDGDGSNRSVNGYVDMVAAVNDGTDRIRGYETAPSRVSQQTGIRRLSLIDTDNNAVDFEVISYRDVSAEEIAAKRPRNHSYGAWNPIVGEIRF